MVTVSNIPDKSLRTYIENLTSAAVSSSASSDAIGRLAMAYDANGFDHAAEITYRIAAEEDPESFKWQYLLALRLQKNGNLQSAIEAATQATELNSSYPATYVRLGNWFLDSGEPHAAHTVYERAIELGAGPAAELGAARSLLKVKQYTRALEILNSVVSRSSHPMAFRLLGDTWRAMGETEKSREYIPYATHTKPMWFDDPLVTEVLTHAKGKNSRIQDIELMLGNELVDDALQALHELEAESVSDVHVQYRFALAYFQIQEFDLAKQRLEKAIQLESVHYPSHLLLASLFQRADDNVKAAEHLERVVAIYPKLQIAHQELGFVRLRLGDTDGALESFENAITLDSTEPNVHYYAGVILGAQGLCDRAVKKFDTALKLDSNHDKARIGLAECVLSQGTPSTSMEHSSNEIPMTDDGASD